jgi:hypothetical protein
MTDYLQPDIDTDPDDLADEAISYLQVLFPGWQPNDGNLDVWLLRAFSQLAAEINDLANSVPTTIFRYFGASLIGVPPIEATLAVGNTTWTTVDSNGHTIPAGTQIGLRDEAGTLWAYETVNDYIIPEGSNTTTVGGISVQAVLAGADSSGLGGVAELIDTLEFVQQVVVENLTTGGLDAEADDDYLNRLRLELRLLAPRPILPDDFSALALNVPGVARATTIDGYDPVTATYNNARTISVAVTDVNGLPVSLQVRQDLQAYLEARREVNFIVNIIDPTYYQIDVAFELVALPTYDLTDVHDRAVLAIQNFLSPATWGQDPTSSSGTWRDTDAVRFLDVADALNNVDGVRFISSLGIAPSGGALARDDISLGGPAAIAIAGDVSGAVSYGS